MTIGDRVRCVQDVTPRGFHYACGSRIGWTGRIVAPGATYVVDDAENPEYLVQLDEGSRQFFRATMLEVIADG